MNSVISVNYKFMEIIPKKLVELILASKYTNGVELFIDYEKENEMKYLDDLVYEIKRNNLILQIHGNINVDIDKQITFIKKLENYSDYLNYPIVVTLHSIYDENKELSKNKTIIYINDLLSKIDSSKIIISLENLNDIYNMDRLEKECIKPIVLNNEKIFFTYDIGHEIMDHGSITNLDKYMIDKIRNVHIHTNDGKLNDHQPIYKNDTYWNELIKGIIYLVSNHYKYNIVFEYDLYACKGNNIIEKIEDYLKSIDYVSQRYIY